MVKQPTTERAGWLSLMRLRGARNAGAEGGATAELRAQLAAVDRSQALLQLDMIGNIQVANDNFLQLLGYRLEELHGQNHGMFLDPQYRASDAQRNIWEALRRDQPQIGQYKCIAKGGREIWLRASYSPVLDPACKPCKVLMLAIDVTEEMERYRQFEESTRETQGTAHQIESTISQTENVVKAAIGGDLSLRIDTRQISGDVQRMAESVNMLLESVSEIVTNVKTASSEVLRGADEISQGNLNLSQRTEEQSSSLEETASSMEEMTSTVKQNADNAGQANQLATAARDQAEKGGAVVGKAVDAMAKINEASKKISDIIGVIDEIAFQTNLLALNAAVEAARAGEQGRGFAVVATEVRSLAGRSATAAKEIKELIQDSVRKVEDGSTLVTQSGQTLDQIVTSVKKVSDIVAEIAAASREQSAGIEQVNQAVMQMDEMTQQNAALVEQATAASQSMAEQARLLTNLMQRYRSGDSFESSAPAPAYQQKVAEPAVPNGTERRTAARPWAAKNKPPARKGSSAAEGAPAAVAPKAVANGTDADWVEF